MTKHRHTRLGIPLPTKTITETPSDEFGYRFDHRNNLLILQRRVMHKKIYIDGVVTHDDHWRDATLEDFRYYTATFFPNKIDPKPLKDNHAD